MQFGPKIRWDSHTLANLAKNISPALAFTPLGLGGTALLAAAGEYGRDHHSLGDLAKAAGSNVAIGATGRGIAGHYGVLGQGGGAAAPASAAPVSAPTPAPVPAAGGLPSDSDLMASRVMHAPLPGPPVDAAAAGGGSTGPTSFLGKVGHVASEVGDFAGNHDKTTAAVLGSVGNLGTLGSQNRAQNAQARLLDLQAEQQQQEMERKKSQDAALEPLRQAIYGKLGQSFAGTP